MYLKIHKSYRHVVAICDKELIGKKFEEGKRQLDIKESFFKGQEVNEEECLKIISLEVREDATFNIVGEKSIKTAIKAGIIAPESVAKIEGVPFTLTLL
ncbi:MAG: DUF424 family protein [Nanoarchaeota archaeon]|nr:DUF424 family protein [Nanoarchaeota archaeon]